uniref:Putative conserved secreted protein midgut overexpressed n=1 Tax=Rhipicephalus microplus TaxID=6941 RepID=A0A6M2CH21_RHIMP
MRQIFTAVFLVAFAILAANAYALPKDGSSVDTVFGSAAREAVYLGEILRDVADTLEKDEQLSAQGEEYFFRHLWNRTKVAVKDAAKNMKISAKEVYNEAKDNIKKTAKEAKHKLGEKAALIVSEMLTKITSGYSKDDTEGYMSFLKVFLNLIRRSASRLVRVGMGLEKSQLS